MQKTLVLGLGESGLAMARWLSRQAVPVRVADTRESPPQLATLRNEFPQVEFVGGTWSDSLLEGCGQIALSPGLSPHHEPLKTLLQQAAQKQIAVVGEIELFAQALAALHASQGYQPKILAITGTNGKTTTTRLTGLLCERAGKTVAVAGNISPAALDVLQTALTAERLPDVWVLELSSFQLATTQTLQADAATILNITQDHLDWHTDMTDYANAKLRIFGAQTIRVLPAELQQEDWVRQAAQTQAEVVWFGMQSPQQNQQLQQPGALGVVHEGGMRWLAEAVAVEMEKPARRKQSAELMPVEVQVNRLMPADALRIRGNHNITNALAALALCRAIGLSWASLLRSLRDYVGEPHRVEWIANLQGVDYYDDSKGTNVGATIAALTAELVTGSQQIILIVGGDGKGQDFAPLASAVAGVARAVVLVGRDAPLLRAALAETSVPLIDAGMDLPYAVQLATQHAQPGDAVLLSPACASFDMFRNYEHRAQVFVQAVQALAEEMGQPC